MLVREVPFVSGTTFYTRHGDVFARVCVALALALLAATFAPARSTIGPFDSHEENRLSADLMQRFESLRARAADVRGYL